jgi:hypothetical protein
LRGDSYGQRDEKQETLHECRTPRADYIYKHGRTRNAEALAPVWARSHFIVRVLLYSWTRLLRRR